MQNRGYGLLLVSGALLLIVGVVASSSFLTTLRHAIGRKPELSPREAERARLRAALGDLVVDFDPQTFAPWLPPLPQDFDREAFLRSLPVLDPPLSQRIIDARNEERY